MKKIFLLGMLICISQISYAQLFKDFDKKLEQRAKKKLEQKAEQKADRHIDKTLDKADKKSDEKIEEIKSGSNKSTPETSSKKANKTVKGANDFVSGTKILATEDFSQDALGDFPVNMSSTSSGEIVEIENKKWLSLGSDGAFILKNFNKDLPKNFTFEFTLTHSEDMNWKSKELGIVFAQAKNLKKDYGKWGENRHDVNGLKVGIHPKEYTKNDIGKTRFFTYQDGKETMKNEKTQNRYSLANATVRVQFWRQETRLRVYIDGNKIWDVQEAFQESNYNALVFVTGSYETDSQRFFITDLKLAEAGADTRHKLIETGTFSTNEILFDTGKATIKPASEKVLSEIGTALQSEPSFKVIIIGHTDSDGNDNENLKLSEKRAESVKVYLNTKFSIDNSRMQIIGKGESEPLVDNNSESGKAKNRRVEFKKN
ncbi:OmpA family protein [Flavobacterium sp. 9AF]|uniref:OmpA family protein n=1 Tax=Flavobacterium sp. 9AF TaxID=2653142 RepID=UPI0012F0042C|nr:OmpA family protein [Flavobacterium sp. 9AF]VXC39800.1 OmpA family protein [Flavobacterium sp. 9AF]